jgi:hypothetical protein
MANIQYGYRRGPRNLVTLPVKSGETFEVGDAVVLSSGYLAKAAAGGAVFGVATSGVLTAPSADAGAEATVDVSTDSLYEWPVGTGTITQAMTGKTCDVSGSQGLDVTASADDCILIVVPNVAANSALIQIRPAAAGVV